MHFENFSRRSGRIPKQVSVKLRWETADGEFAVDARTLVLSQYGCVARCATPHRVPRELMVIDTARAVQATAQVVYREVGDVDGFTLALEFTDVENFWAMSFPRSSTAPAGS